jgi:hypothetical protein
VKNILILIFFFSCFAAKSQSDSAKPDAIDGIVVDSAKIDSSSVVDSVKVKKIVAQTLSWKDDTVFFNSFKGPLMPKPSTKAVMQIAAEKPFESRDELFYTLLGVFAFFAVIRYFFPKYFPSLFSLLFQSSFRQKQTRDQLLQDIIPSILSNILFFGTAGLFVAIALDRLNMSPFDFWQTFFYASAGILIIYIVKYLFLLFFGWVFNVRESAAVYSFIVFLINKIIGVLLLPLLLLVAFSGASVSNIVITVAVCIVILLFIYRYIAVLAGVRGDLRINALHFFIYLCAVEVAPLLVIFKLLANQISPSI